MVRRVVDLYREAFSGLGAGVWTVALVTFVNRSGTMVLPFLTLYLTHEKGLAPQEAGRILGLYGVGALGGAWLGGRLSDALGPRRVMLLSLTLAGAGFLTLGSLDSPASIALMVMVLSLVGEGVRPATGAAIASAALPGRRVRAFTLNRLAANLGLTFGSAAGGLLAVHSYDWLFIADGGTCLLAATVLGLTGWRGRGRGEGWSAPAAASPASPPWRDRGFLALLALMVVFATMLFQIFSTWPLTLRDLYGFGEERIGLLLGINTLIIVLFEMVLIHRLAGVNPLRVAAIGSLVFGAGLGLTPLGSGFGFAVASVMVWTLGEMLALPMVEGYIAGRAGEGRSGRYMAMLSIAFSIAFILAPVCGTWVYQHLGPRILWGGCAGLGVMIWVGMQSLSGVAESPAPPLRA